jgi:ArsR family transcriptional regulator, zinc-responsive transcriptional repressor
VDAQIDRDPTERELDLAVETLKLLADRIRLQIIWALVHGEHSVNELAHHLGVNPAGVSQHLAKLRLARLVTVRREGTKAFYAAENPHVRKLAEQALFHADHLAGGVVHHDDRDDRPASPRGQISG